MIVDLFLVYHFIKRLATPFNKWKAYELGIIDENGEILKPKKERRKLKEREAFGKFDLMVLKLKKLLEKIPGGSSRVASYAAALWLIKEGNERDENVLTEETMESELQKYMQFVEENAEVFEDAPANNVGGGAIAGVGVGPDGEPGVSRKKQKEYASKNKKRKTIRTFKDMMVK